MVCYNCDSVLDPNLLKRFLISNEDLMHSEPVFTHCHFFFLFKCFEPLSLFSYPVFRFHELLQLLPERCLCLVTRCFYANCPIWNVITLNRFYNLTLSPSRNLIITTKSLPNLFLTQLPQLLRMNDSVFVHLIYITSTRVNCWHLLSILSSMGALNPCEKSYNSFMYSFRAGAQFGDKIPYLGVEKMNQTHFIFLSRCLLMVVLK